MSKKMKFTIEFEVPEDIEKFFGIELHLSTLKENDNWRSVYAFSHRKQKVRNGKHLHFDGVGNDLLCTIKTVGELSKEEEEKQG